MAKAEKKKAEIKVPAEIVSNLCGSLVKRRGEVHWKMRKNRTEIDRLAKELKDYKTELAALHQMISELEKKMRGE
jgi:uncharacterized coiled-coil DUF342 family protein